MMSLKDCCHGFLRSRAKRRDDPGTSPDPRWNRLRLGQRRNATIKPTGWGDSDRGPHQSKTAKGGSGLKPEGKRLATDKRHRVDTDQEGRAFPCLSGGRSGWQGCALSKRGGSRAMNDKLRRSLVPMPPFSTWEGIAGRASSLTHTPRLPS